MILCPILASVEGLLVAFCFATDALTNSPWFLKSLSPLHKRHKCVCSILFSGNTEACCLLGLALLSTHLPAFGQLVLPVVLGKEWSSLSFSHSSRGSARTRLTGIFPFWSPEEKKPYLLITNKCKGCGTSQTQAFLWWWSLLVYHHRQGHCFPSCALKSSLGKVLKGKILTLHACDELPVKSYVINNIWCWEY